MTAPPDKTCASCGRPFSWRRKWARNWDEVRYCSDACRRHKVTDTDRALEDALRDALVTVGVADPADAARTVGDAVGDETALREPARRAARRIVAAGDADVTQRGRVVDPATARGDFVLRRRP